MFFRKQGAVIAAIEYTEHIITTKAFLCSQIIAAKESNFSQIDQFLGLLIKFSQDNQFEIDAEEVQQVETKNTAE